ncbi:MAG: galactokinase [Elusimicrobiota bacterium]
MNINIERESIEKIVGAVTDAGFTAMQERVNKCLARFNEVFPGVADVQLYRAPGRVNIIGEHTDYNGLPVLPIAIDRDIIAVVSKRKDHKIVFGDTKKDFPLTEFEITRKIQPFEKGFWGNYIKAAVQTVVDYVDHAELKGVNAVLDSTVPIAAGLSSSAALTVLTSKVVTELNDIKISGLTLAQKIAEGERYVGTDTGGMDQAISLLGKLGYALKIDFSPLEIHAVQLPKEYVFVVANSNVHAEKSGAAQMEYNRRVSECRLGTVILEKYLQKNGYPNAKLKWYGTLREAKYKTVVENFSDILEKVFHPEPYSLEEVAKTVGCDTQNVVTRCLTLKTGKVFDTPVDGFKIKQRAVHVITEWQRVERCVAAMERGDIDTVGALMDISHKSLARDYEVSCPELDRLVEAMMSSGAVGARLTGAGFGGCAIALVKREEKEVVVSKIVEKFYGGNAKPGNIFTVIPTAGAGRVV